MIQDAFILIDIILMLIGFLLISLSDIWGERLPGEILKGASAEIHTMGIMRVPTPPTAPLSGNRVEVQAHQIMFNLAGLGEGAQQMISCFDSHWQCSSITELFCPRTFSRVHGFLREWGTRIRFAPEGWSTGPEEFQHAVCALWWVRKC